MRHIFVNDTWDVRNDFTVLLIILFGIFDEDSYTVSVSVGQEDEADIIAGYLLSFGIAVTRPRLVADCNFFAELWSNQSILSGLAFCHGLIDEVFVFLWEQCFFTEYLQESRGGQRSSPVLITQTFVLVHIVFRADNGTIRNA